MKAKTQLGRGMAALLSNNAMGKTEPSENIEMNSQNPYMVDIQKLITNKDQPRKIFKEDDLRELAASIKENGIIQPIVVSPKENGKLEIIAGERRYRASKMIGLSQIPVIIKNVTKKDSMVMAIIENIQRSDLNCVEEGLAYYQLMNEFNLTQEEVAKKLGKERSSIANYLRLLKLPREVLNLLQKEKIFMGHAKILGALKDESRLKELALQVAEENLSVRELEALIKANKPVKASKQAKTKDKNFEPLKTKLERKTGFHLDIKSRKNGAGQLVIKFTNKEEFNTIYEYLMN